MERADELRDLLRQPAETHCNTNPAITGNQPTGQMYDGYYVGLPPDQGSNYTHYYHNGALYSDPRISAYIGMGLHQMPGNVWWRSEGSVTARADWGPGGGPVLAWAHGPARCRRLARGLNRSARCRVPNSAGRAGRPLLTLGRGLT